MPTAEESALVDTVRNGFAVGAHFDIDLMLKVGENARTITQTAETIRITIPIPENLVNTDASVTRTYAIVRIHDGEAKVLEVTDNGDGTVTFGTNLFSVYTLIYQDTKKTEHTSKNHSPGDGQTTAAKTSGDISRPSVNRGLFSLPFLSPCMVRWIRAPRAPRGSACGRSGYGGSASSR